MYSQISSFCHLYHMCMIGYRNSDAYDNKEIIVLDVLIFKVLKFSENRITVWLI